MAKILIVDDSRTSRRICVDGKKLVSIRKTSEKTILELAKE